MSKVEIGYYIREKRENLKISQESVAFALDISQAAYSKIERNETKLRVDQVYKIASCFGVSVYDLLPPSVASDMLGDNMFSIAWSYTKLAFGKVKSWLA